MGNRALIATENKDLEVYVHWYGGREAVQAFIDFCKAKGYARPEKDGYGWARLCQVIGNFFGGNCSLGIFPYGKMDADFCDNGRYTIRDWEISEHTDGDAELDFGEYTDTIARVNRAQPEKERLTDEELDKVIRARLEVWQ